MKKKIAIFDRDGVINKSNINNGYIGFKENFNWVTGAKKAIKYLKNKNYKVLVITNQSGIARNYFKYTDVTKLHNFIQKQLKNYGTKIDHFYFCPHHKNGVIKKYKINCNCRKPKNGQFKKIKKKWNIDYKNTFMIGDQKSDMEFAKKSKIKGFLFKGKNLYKFVLNIVK